MYLRKTAGPWGAAWQGIKAAGKGLLGLVPKSVSAPLAGAATGAFNALPLGAKQYLKRSFNPLLRKYTLPALGAGAAGGVALGRWTKD
jgi:hypothetical protein